MIYRLPELEDKIILQEYIDSVFVQLTGAGD